MTREYFKNQFNGVVYNYFEYDSNNLQRVLTYSQSSEIDIMVINIQAFNSEAGSINDKKGNRNIIYRQMEAIGGNRAIDLISATRPIIIIDEPQSVDNTELSKQAINNLKPSVGFRYSATHRDKSYPTLYRLGAVEAYEQELVKQIEVYGIEFEDDGNKAYLRLISVSNKDNKFTARIEMYIKGKNKIDKKTVTCKKGDDLGKKTKLSAYTYVGFITDIDMTPGREAVYFSGEPNYITLSETQVNDLEEKRIQINRTINEHLEKENKLTEKGIKVLSLFFIDKVSNYRMYDEEGNEKLGPYAKIFEEEYNKLIKLPKFKHLNNDKIDVSEIHDGYFSVDRKNRVKNTGGSSKDDETTYEIIMKDKEGLLTFYDEKKGNTKEANKIRFIFSHSALKEGWDNPNVFQIATLVETKDTITKRQKIGRGLRIAVNQEGERVPGFDVNTLTIMANENYKQFAEELQKEYEKDGIRFGVFDEETFATIITFENELTDELEVLGTQESKEIIKQLKEKGYLNTSNRATPKLQQAIQDKEIDLSEEYKKYGQEILDIVSEKVKVVPIKKREDRKEIQVSESALESDVFMELWNRIKYKTNYRVNILSGELKNNIINGTTNFPGFKKINVQRRRYKTSVGKLEHKKSGIEYDEKTVETDGGYLENQKYLLPDIITQLQNETGLTRRTIVEILTEAGNLKMFEENPASYIMQAIKIINKHKSDLIINNIQYYKNGEEYDKIMFKDSSQMTTYLDNETTDYKVKNYDTKSITDYIKTDSNIENEFAKQLDQSRKVKFFVKLPSEFLINTPIGGYNPDWGVVIEEDGEEKIYFITETKGTTDMSQLRESEQKKFKSGQKHFEALDTKINYGIATKLEDLR